jgi:signal transduction histidine kinase
MALVVVSAVPSSRRTAALRRIGSALRAMAGGERDRDVLLVADRFGPEAGAWNELLAAREGAVDETDNDVPDRRENGSTAGVLPGGAALDAMPIGLMALDDEGRLTFCNGAAAAMMGVDRRGTVGEPVMDREAFAEIVPAFEKIVRGTTPRVTVEFSRGEGARQDVVRVTARALRKDDEATVMVLLEDITQQRIADEARNGFVAQATHELRAPLTNIRLYAEEAIDVGADDPQAVARALNVVNQEARRLERVVGDMLSVSEIEAATMTLQIDDVPLARLFEDLRLDYAAQAAEKSTDLEFALPAKLESIRADREKIALLLHNVLGNAIKYTPEGGEVRVAVEAGETELTVRVTDNGPGIAPEDHEKIFQKFYRTDDARLSESKGSGLGLALAREIARLHGGDITLESEPGRGSTFTIRVPSGTAGARSRAA